MELQQLLSVTRRAIDTYTLINEGDHIAVGVSAGKDSLSLLIALRELRRFYPKSFSLSAITVDLGLGNLSLGPVRALCEELSVPYYVVDTQIGDILFEIRKEKNPCSLCAKLRKGALNEQALKIGANKIAYAHHKDDLIETMMMSLIYEGRFNTFSPLTYLDNTKLYVIRPFIFADEREIAAFARNRGLPVCKNPCPMDGYTKRQYAKELIASICRDNPGADKRMLRAILDGHISGWPEAIKNPRYQSKHPEDALIQQKQEHRRED